jgi:hypothetical protein
MIIYRRHYIITKNLLRGGGYYFTIEATTMGGGGGSRLFYCSCINILYVVTALVVSGESVQKPIDRVGELID